MHLWYRCSGERSANLRHHGLAVDIKAHGGFIVAPPSRRWSGARTGVEYAFEQGGWADLPHLPTLPDDALRRLTGQTAMSTTGPIAQGVRNDTVFRQALRLALLATDAIDLAAMADDFNGSQCDQPLELAEVTKASASAWRYQVEGRNWVAVGAIQVTNDHLDRLPSAEALWLLVHLRRAHAATDRTFGICARAMAEAGTIRGMGERSIRKATRQLVEAG